MGKNIKGKNRGRSGKLIKFYTGGTLSVALEIENIDPATNDDEATLESVDGSYKQTLKVADEGIKVDRRFLRFTFTGVKPGKNYTLTYDLKKDIDGHELGKIVMFQNLLLESKDLDNLDPVNYEVASEHNKSDIPVWNSESYNTFLSLLYKEPDPDADQEAIANKDESENKKSFN